MQKQIFYELVERFIVGGIILSGATYLANYSNPLLAGILVTLPLELVSLFFVKEHKLYSYSRSILIMSIATVIPVLYYYLIHPLGTMDTVSEIVSSFAVWFIVGVFLYCFVPMEMYSK